MTIKYHEFVATIPYVLVPNLTFVITVSSLSLTSIPIENSSFAFMISRFLIVTLSSLTIMPVLPSPLIIVDEAPSLPYKVISSVMLIGSLYSLGERNIVSPAVALSIALWM